MKFKPLQDMTTLTTTVCVALLTVVTALSGSGLVLLWSFLPDSGQVHRQFLLRLKSAGRCLNSSRRSMRSRRALTS
jgi:hypothetical protein